MKKALVLAAHGSRREQSNIEVYKLAEKLMKKCSDRYQIIIPAFLELADPLIPKGIEACIEKGASSVIVLPYFLNSGRHVIEDIPDIVNKSIKTHPNVDIRIAPHLGASDLMIDLLIASADSAELK